MIKIQNSLPFHKFRSKIVSDITKKALNCTASLYQLTALLMPLVSSGVLFCDQKPSSPKSRIWLLQFLNPAGFEMVKSNTTLFKGITG